MCPRRPVFVITPDQASSALEALDVALNEYGFRLDEQVVPSTVAAPAGGCRACGQRVGTSHRADCPHDGVARVIAWRDLQHELVDQGVRLPGGARPEKWGTR